MELNKRSKKTAAVVVNSEGSVVVDRNPLIQLYLESSQLNIKSDSFYVEAKDKLSSVLQMVNKETDIDYIFGLAKFLADRGLKLGPVVLTSALAGRGYSFNGKNINYIYNTPQRIAEAVALNNLKLTHLNNSFKKHVLKSALENMNENTLKKGKMKRKKVKLADLIKLLRPHPKNPEIAALYKAIIENSKSASLSEKKDFMAIKTSTNISDKEKQKMMYDAVINKTVSINQLIRNLKYYAENYDFKKNIELQNAILDSLGNVKNYRFLNIFDVITAAIFVPQFEKPLFEIVKKFVVDVKQTFDFGKETVVLFDVSGSMSGNLDNSFKYMALISLLYEDVTLRLFAEELYSGNKDTIDMIKMLKNGSYQSAKTLLNKMFLEHGGGTSLVASTESLVEDYEKNKAGGFAKALTLTVISDEVSWVEGEDLTSQIKELNKKIKDNKMILINPSVTKGTVFTHNVVGIASLTSSILFDMALLVNSTGFIKYIKGYVSQNENSVNITKPIIEKTNTEVKINERNENNGKRKPKTTRKPRKPTKKTRSKKRK